VLSSEHHLSFIFFNDLTQIPRTFVHRFSNNFDQLAVMIAAQLPLNANVFILSFLSFFNI